VRLVRERPVIDRQADAQREDAEDDAVDLRVVDLREAARALKICASPMAQSARMPASITQSMW